MRKLRHNCPAGSVLWERPKTANAMNAIPAQACAAAKTAPVVSNVRMGVALVAGAFPSGGTLAPRFADIRSDKSTSGTRLARTDALAINAHTVAQSLSHEEPMTAFANSGCSNTMNHTTRTSKRVQAV